MCTGACYYCERKKKKIGKEKGVKEIETLKNYFISA
jgi:thioredoxin-related protein